MVHPKEGDVPFFVEWKKRWNVEVFGRRQQYSVASLLGLMVIAALLGIYGQSIAYFFADLLSPLWMLTIVTIASVTLFIPVFILKTLFLSWKIKTESRYGVVVSQSFRRSHRFFVVTVWVGDVVGLRTIDRFRASGSMVSDASGQIRKVMPLKKLFVFIILAVIFVYSSWATSWTVSYLPFEENWRNYLVFTPACNRS